MDKLFFDIESTGPDTGKDRIVELAIKIIAEDGTVVLNKAKRYNPQMKISAKAIEIHGIKDSDVKDCPTFSQDAKKLKKLFEDKIIITYNGLRFDVPMLLQEFHRAGVNVNLSGEFIDVLKLETALTPRDLSTVYKKYSGHKLEDAHAAGSDVDATQYVYDAQMNFIEKHSLDQEALLKTAGPGDSVDFFGKLKRDKEGFLIFNFGKENGNRVRDRQQYAAWILDNDFPDQVKNLIRQEQTRDITQNLKTNKNEKLPAPVTKKTDGYIPLFSAEEDLPF